MFAILNPPLHRKRKKSKAKRRAAKAKRWFRKPTKLSSIFTPGGGIIHRKIAANRKIRFNSFLGINPLSRRHGAVSSLNKGVKVMARRRGRNPSWASPRQTGLLSVFKPKNLVAVTPILAGVVANGLVVSILGKKIPYTGRGIGNIALGIASAGLLGMLGRHANKQLGDGIFVGGVVGTLGCAFQRFMVSGLSSLSLGGSGDGDMDGLGNYQFDDRFNTGFGNFTSVPAIVRASSQYSLPHANANYMGARLATPQTPAQNNQVRGVSDAMQESAIGAVLGQDDVSGIMGM